MGITWSNIEVGQNGDGWVLASNSRSGRVATTVSGSSVWKHQRVNVVSTVAFGWGRRDEEELEEERGA